MKNSVSILFPECRLVPVPERQRRGGEQVQRALAEMVLLVDLPSHVLLVTWPPERLRAGCRACKILRAALTGAHWLGLEDMWLLGQNPARVAGLTASLCRMPYLQIVALVNCGLNLPSLTILIGCSSLSRLTGLSLMYNDIDDNGCRILADGLTNMAKLEILCVARNCITAEGAACLGCALPCLTNLLALDLGGNRLGDSGMKALWPLPMPQPGTGWCCALATLRLRGNFFGPSGARILASALAGGTALTALDIGGNGIGTEGMYFIAKALKMQTQLKWLRLHDTDLEWAACRFLGHLLPHLPCLEMLRLQRNRLSTIGVQELSWILQTHTKLECLEMSGMTEDNYSCLHMQAWDFLGKCYMQLPCLRKLGLSKCKMKDGGATSLAPALATLTRLVWLDVTLNDLTRSGVTVLGWSLRGVPELRCLQAAQPRQRGMALVGDDLVAPELCALLPQMVTLYWGGEIYDRGVVVPHDAGGHAPCWLQRFPAYKDLPGTASLGGHTALTCPVSVLELEDRD